MRPDRARYAGALGVLRGALVVAVDAAFRLGDWAEVLVLDDQRPLGSQHHHGLDAG